MTAPKPGDRVRIVETVEGVVHSVGESSICVNIDRGDHGGLEWFEFDTASVEVLPPPEPDWQPGDVAADRAGIAHLRVECGPKVGDVWQTFNGEFHDDSFPLRPLTLLIRDGVPVTP